MSRTDIVKMITMVHVNKGRERTNSRHIVKTNRIKSLKRNTWDEGKGKIKDSKSF